MGCGDHGAALPPLRYPGAAGFSWTATRPAERRQRQDLRLDADPEGPAEALRARGRPHARERVRSRHDRDPVGGRRLERHRGCARHQGRRPHAAFRRGSAPRGLPQPTRPSPPADWPKLAGRFPPRPARLFPHVRTLPRPPRSATTTPIPSRRPFGRYGGRFVAETLMGPLQELADAYDAARVIPRSSMPTTAISRITSAAPARSTSPSGSAAKSVARASCSSART